MKILLTLGTSAGGVGRHVRTLADGFEARGHEVVVAGPAETRDRFGFTQSFAEVPVADRPHPVNDARTVRVLRRIEADVVHAHGLRAGALAALARPRRLVVTLHNAVTAGGAIGAVYATLERVVARRADVVLGVSPDLCERMTALGARAVAPAVVPAPPLADLPATTEFGGRRVLLTVARLAQQKGLEVLLDAAAGPYPQDVVFAVAGEGPLREALQERVTRENLPVTLLGPRDDVAALLKAATALVVPSRWEGQPLTVQEALRAGVPVVGFAVGGVPPMTGDAGLLVTPGDAGELRSALLRLLADDALVDGLRAAALARGRALPGEADAVEAALKNYG
ncbi:glycosyltransferase family 4 protein [Herbidospora sp. NBRC 101105]|uniref:glycosyltransferase family 4 protein n=1 Tax=Herbidospora sp. NBRC 101105 TaxID=3032195 RepID=UPI0024A0F8BF|nr:glycosyltransferase family 4 protein [Herbidospora sp. NBRC 101105]GLX96832.1 glycosyl transferase [Herbidospora sp. NBRC 101105]